MSIFNSLGSNYNLGFVFKSLFSNSVKNSMGLKTLLENKYKGKATLVYKGREALELGLNSLNLPEGSFIAINGFTCFAVYEAIKKAKLNVEYLDIEKGDLNFSPLELKKHLDKNSKIKAVIIQNTLGYPSRIEHIDKICKEKKIILIEDLAHSVGTMYASGLEAGSVGDLIVLSFSQDKIIDGISGGALITKGAQNISLKNIPAKKQFIDRFYPLLTCVTRNTYEIILGKILNQICKSLKLLSTPMDKMDDRVHNLPNWYCNLTNSAFADLKNNLDHRKKIANIYAKNINPKITAPKILDSINLSSNLRFPIFVNNRQGLISNLKRNNIFVSDIWYDAPIAPKKYLTQTDYNHQCPNSELASAEILNLPTHINVSEKDARIISQLLNLWIK